MKQLTIDMKEHLTQLENQILLTGQAINTATRICNNGSIFRKAKNASVKGQLSKVNCPKKGFTIIEILVVLGIIGLLVGIALPSLSKFRSSKALDTTSEGVLVVLSTARGDTLSAKAGEQYGVHFEAGKFVLYTGATYSGADPDNKEYILENIIEISSFTNADVLFDKLTGNTAQDGTVVLRVKADTATTRTITIAKSGIASLQ